MITNTELKQIIKFENWMASKDGVHMARELLCAREVIRLAKEVDNGSLYHRVLRDQIKVYDALCAPQEKTGEVK